MDMYVKCGCIDIVMYLFYEMFLRNICMWNVMLLGFLFYGYGFLVLEFFKEMEYVGMVFNDVIFVVVLFVCSYVGVIDEG